MQTGARPDNNKSKDMYLNFSQTIGGGDGQSAGQRIGVFGYYGWQPVAVPGNVVSPTGETAGCPNERFYRIGGSASFNWNTFNVRALYLKGLGDKAFNTLDATQDYEFDGGLAALDWAGLLNSRLVTSVLYNWVSPPSYDEDRTVKAYSALIRYYLGDWTAVNVAIHGEYTHREMGEDNSTAEDVYSMLVDFAF